MYNLLLGCILQHKTYKSQLYKVFLLNYLFAFCGHCVLMDYQVIFVLTDFFHLKYIYFPRAINLSKKKN